MYPKLERVIRTVISSSTQVVTTSPTNTAHVSQPCSGTPCCTYLANPQPVGVTPCFTNS